jgi:ABC-type branched-subunit amino acid transport system substrate-binding protein
VALSVVTALATVLSGLAATGAGAGTKSSGEPVTVVAIGEWEVAAVGTSNPEWPGAIKARAKAINAKGGLEDATGAKHRLRVIECNANLDANTAGQCAREAVDEGAIAVIGTTLGNPSEESAVFPLLEEANIASIGTVGNGPVALSNPISYSITASSIGIFAGMPHQLTSDGASSANLVISDIGPASAAFIGLMQQALAQGEGSETGEPVLVPADATDLAPYVAAATTGDPDGIVSAILGPAQGTFLREVKQSGFSGKQVTESAFLSQDLLDELGDAGDGVLATGFNMPPTAKKVPGIKQYLKDMKAYDADLPLSDLSVQYWLSTYVLEQVVKTLDTVDAASVNTAMGEIDGLDMLGITPPLSTTASVDVGLPGVTQVFNPTVTFLRVKNGKLVLASKQFFDAFTGEFVETS